MGENKQNQRKTDPMLITTMIVAVIVGLGVGVYLGYALYNHNEDEVEALEEQVETLQDTIDDLQEENTSLLDTADDAHESAAMVDDSEEDASDTDTLSSTKDVAVTYERAGLLSAEQKSDLEEKLIDPYIAYYSDSEHELPGPLVSVNVVVPQSEGEPYEVTTIFLNTEGVDTGDEEGINQSFLYGEHGSNLDYWYPVCLGDCPFSDDFAAEYPEVVSAAK